MDITYWEKLFWKEKYRRALRGAMIKIVGYNRKLTHAADEFIVKIVPAADHKHDNSTVGIFIDQPIADAAGVESADKKTAQRSMERLALRCASGELPQVVFCGVARGARQRFEILLRGRGEKNAHSSTSGSNLIQIPKLAILKQLLAGFGPPFDFLNHAWMPKHIFTYEPPKFANLTLQFIYPCFGVYSHISMLNRSLQNVKF